MRDLPAAGEVWMMPRKMLGELGFMIFTLPLERMNSAWHSAENAKARKDGYLTALDYAMHKLRVLGTRKLRDAPDSPEKRAVFAFAEELYRIYGNRYREVRPWDPNK